MPYTLPTLDLDKKAQLEHQPAFAPGSTLVVFTPLAQQPGTRAFYEEELTARR